MYMYINLYKEREKILLCLLVTCLNKSILHLLTDIRV